LSKENLKLPHDLLEPAILIHSLKNVSFFLKIKPYIQTKGKKSFFQEAKLQKIFNNICVWYDKYKRFPKEKELLILTDKIEKDDDVKILTKSLIKDIYEDEAEKEISIDFVEDETKKFIKENQIYEAMLSSQIDIENQNYDVIAEKMRKAITVNFDKDLGISIRDVKKTLEEINNLDNDNNVVPSGFLSLDREDVLDGGFRNGTLSVFSGISGIGKSGLLGNLAINAFLEGKKVMVYTFEMATSRMLTRYYANLISMTKREIISDNDKTKIEIENLLNTTVGDIRMKQYPANTTSSNDLIAHLNDLKMYENWEPDILIADYILIMATNDKSISSDNSYKYYKTISEELRNIGLLFDIPVLSASQLNRGAMDDKGGSKALTTAKDISESKGIVDGCDNFFTINQTAKDRELGKIMLYSDKVRNGSKGQKLKMSIDYKYMKFAEL